MMLSSGDCLCEMLRRVLDLSRDHLGHSFMTITTGRRATGRNRPIDVQHVRVRVKCLDVEHMATGRNLATALSRADQWLQAAYAQARSE